jgi:spermidine synthase
MSSTSEAVNRPSPVVSVGAFSLLCACFVLSGIAALVYQTAWTRQFAIVFGTSELAVATVLAAYMGGLAAGAWLAERFLPRVTRPVFTYALLELGIAVVAVAVVPFLLHAADAALQTLFGGQASPPDSDHAGTTLFYLLSAFVSLALPTTLMGATLPMLARYAVAEDAQIGRRIGLLYAMNTAGAVAGALVTAFVLLPELGLQHTVWVGALFNGIVFLLALALARRVPYVKPPRGYTLDGTPDIPPLVVQAPKHSLRFPGPIWVLPLMLPGAGAFFQEVLWSRMLSHVVGSSIYAFGVMVASFLTGIALGGALGATVARNRERAALALAWALLAAAAAAGAAYLQLDALLPKTGGLLAAPQVYFGFLRLPNTLFSGLLLLPMTLAIGMTYPLAVRVLASDASDAATASARVYAWNTVGAIVGSLAAGFLLIPALRYEGAIRVAVCASAVLGIAAAWVLVRVNRIAAAAVSLLAIAACALFRPEPPLRLLVTSPLNVGDKGRMLYYDIGRSASVIMLAQDGGLALRTNGLPEALMESPGSLQRFSGENWLSPLAVIARPQAREMLIVGFGGGVVVEGVPPSIRHIDVIELEPKVIEANRLTGGMRKRDPLNDPRLNIIVNDARGALRLTTHRYDAIVSQPSHPWTAGASHLYTREFMQLAHDHLTSDGVFVQWMNVIFMDEDLLRSLTATLLDVFSDVRVYRPDPNTVVFLASDQPLDLEAQLARSGKPLRDAPLHYARFGINTVEDLVAALVLDAEGARAIALGAPLITDDDNRIATSSVYERGRGLSGETSGRFLAAHDPLQRADSVVYGELEESLSFPYLARRNSVFSALDPSLADRVARMARILGEGPRGEYLHAFYFRMLRQQQRANELLRLAIDDYATDEPLRLEFLRGWFNELAIGAAPADVNEVAGGVTGAPAQVLAAARHAAKSEWREVAMADSELASIPWTSVWYPEALELRVNWRIRLTDPKSKKRYGDEAVLMIDRLAIMNPTLNLYALRTQAGFAAGRPDVVIESVANYAQLATGMIRAGVNPPESFRKDAQTLSGILDGVAALPGADAVRIAEVRSGLAAFPPK